MKDVIIVGGGVVGMLAARLLQQAGMQVMLVEQGELGRESTWAGGGILSPLYPWHYPAAIHALVQYGQQHYPALCQALLQETGVDPQLLRSGLLYTDTAEWPQAQAWAAQYGVTLQHLPDRAAVQACEPQVAADIASGMLLPDVAQVRNPRIAHALRSSLRLSPVVLAEFTPVKRLAVGDGRVLGVYIGEELVPAKRVVVAAGAWSALFPEWQAVAVEVRPVLGQMVLVRAEQRDLIQRIILHEGRYVIPRNDGRILCGSTLEAKGFAKVTTADAAASLLQTLYRLVPALHGLPILNHWAGLRPGSPDGVPYIGEHPDIAGLYLNAGHYRYGLTMGLGSAQLLVDMLLGNAPCVDPAPYALRAPRQPSAEWQVLGGQ